MANVHPISDWAEEYEDDGKMRYQETAGFAGAGLGGAYARQAQPRPQISVQFPTKEVIAVLTAISAVLAARLGLILAGVAAFMLGLRAVESGNYAPQLIFALTIFCPMVWLSANRQV